MANPRSLPDVSKIDSRNQYETLDWVGMNGIHIPTLLADSIHGECALDASVQAYVNLENTASRGIHMSRLYLQLSQNLANKSLDVNNLSKTLKGFLNTHKTLSSRAFIEMAFDFSVNRPALKSDNNGWKSYPTKVIGSLDEGGIALELWVTIPYSSTCPASAALSRQLIQDAFTREFADEPQATLEQMVAFLGSTDGIVATPHSQRSLAQVKVKLDVNSSNDLPLTELINQVEGVLKTAVQTAVKREDEQEFALLNGQNLLFCEDAARRVKSVLNGCEHYLDFWLRVNHLESLHAHDAVAVVTKQIAGGYQPLPGPGVS